MKQMRSYITTCCMFLLLTLPLSSISYAKQASTPFKKIVFFGDSLSDNGNFYNDVFGFMPKSPPYFNGRFTNGITWAEYVEKYFFDQGYVATSNYAVGGQTAVFHNPMGGYLPYTLTMSLDNYLLHSIFTDRSTSLYIIWIGANDYMPGVTDMDGLTTKVVDAIKATVESLVYYGGTNILVLNLPDISKSPFGLSSGYTETLHATAMVHNLKLDAAITDLQTAYPTANIQLYQISQLFDEYVQNAEDANAAYSTHIKLVDTSCWTGGYTFKQKPLTPERIAQQYMQHMQTVKKGLTATNNGNTPDAAELANYIITSPDLTETYLLSDHENSGVKPCSNPDDYLFWDKVHPTAAAHKVIAEKVIPFINEKYEVAK